jgi:hypothetical protein
MEAIVREKGNTKRFAIEESAVFKVVLKVVCVCKYFPQPTCIRWNRDCDQCLKVILQFRDNQIRIWKVLNRGASLHYLRITSKGEN